MSNIKLKNLSKVIYKKPLMDCLSCICVKDGMASVTDLELSMHMPCDAADGLYDGKAWGNGRFLQKIDISTEDFQSMPSIDNADYIGKFCSDKLKDILPTVSMEIKFNLGGFLYVFGENDYAAIATDGHRLHYVGNVGIKSENNFIVSHRAGLFLMDCPVWEAYKDEFNLFFKCGSVLVSSRIIDQKFPNYAAVIPNKGEHIGDESLIDFMSHFHREKHKFGVRSRNNGFFIKTHNGQFVCEMEVPDIGNFISHGPMCNGPHEVSMAFNGEYIADINKIPGQKSVMWTANDECLHVKTESGGCVVMPLTL